MKKTYIYVLTLSALTNDKHIAIVDFMARALELFSLADSVVGRFVEAFLAAYDTENKAFQRIDRKELTKKLNEADTDRINALRVLRDALKIFLLMKDDPKKTAAARILDVIDLYGGTNIYNMPVDARTGVLNNLIEDLEAPLREAVLTLELVPTVVSLKAANEYFLTCQSDRIMSDAEYGKSTMAEARTATDRIWRALVEEVNNTIAYGTEENRVALIPFAKYMNVEIDKYRIQTGQGVGGSTSAGSGSGSGSDSGSDSEDGGAGDEVLYATATFHFADHTEEDLRQPVGSLLEAPENTEGYVWEPAVPELMPAEDTAYYEMPIAAEEENPDEPNEGGDEPGEGDDSNEGGDDTPKPVATVVFRNKDFQTIYTLTRKAGEEISAEDWPSPEEEGYRWNMTRSKVNDIIANLTTDTTITVQAVS